MIGAAPRCTDHHYCRCMRAAELAAQDRLGEAVDVHYRIPAREDPAGRVIPERYVEVPCRDESAGDPAATASSDRGAAT